MNTSKKLIFTLLVGFIFTVSVHLHAQTTVEKGKTIAIEIQIPFESKAKPSSSGFGNTNKSGPMDCNIQVTHGSEKTNVRVDAKTHKGIYQFKGRRLGEETIRWEGKIKFRGLKTLGACNGKGQLTVITIESDEEIKATAEVQKAEEEAKQVQATIDAQAARLAELATKLKAAV
ncbi:MAG: hypothetical protein HN564_04520, partial [Flavobacteriales bacterium]|nr:hypothetical protein [Flavobacteriales bacterium]